jgi:type IV secretory pathway ATPase VirB11/archaellum biosynthesis ATPase
MTRPVLAAGVAAIAAQDGTDSIGPLSTPSNASRIPSLQLYAPPDTSAAGLSLSLSVTGRTRTAIRSRAAVTWAGSNSSLVTILMQSVEICYEAS